MHGNEPSGTDAALRVLREIADRTDCAGRQVRKNVVTVVVPIENLMAAGWATAASPTAST